MTCFIRGPHPDSAAALNVPANVERRMGRLTRMACAEAFRALDLAHCTRVDGIYWGTGLGCLEDTEHFLDELRNAGDRLLSPTAFMRSTHNTVAGQLALLLVCEGPNITCAQELFSFHHALLHAVLHLDRSPAHTVLVGAADERTPLTERLVQAAGGIAPGEGTASFVLSGTAASHDAARVVELWQTEASGARTWDERLHACGVTTAQVACTIIARDPFSGAAPWSPAQAIELPGPRHGSSSAHLFGKAVEAVRAHTSEERPYVLLIERCQDQEAAILLRAC